jgi:hypothetical protein
MADCSIQDCSGKFQAGRLRYLVGPIPALTDISRKYLSSEHDILKSLPESCHRIFDIIADRALITALVRDEWDKGGFESAIIC